MESLTASELLWYVLAILALGVLIGAGFTWLKWKAFHRKEISMQLEGSRFREDELFEHIQRQEARWESKFRKSKEAYADINDAFRVLREEFIEATRNSFDDLAETAFSRRADQYLREYERRYEEISEALLPMNNLLSSAERRISRLEDSGDYDYKELKRQIASLVETQNALIHQVNILFKESDEFRESSRARSSRRDQRENQLPPRRKGESKKGQIVQIPPTVVPLNSRDGLKDKARKLLNRSDADEHFSAPLFDKEDADSDSGISPDSILPFRDLGTDK